MFEMLDKNNHSPFVPKVALAGESGSGKSLSAIKVARGYCGSQGRILFADTENAAQVYNDGSLEIGKISPRQKPSGGYMFVWIDFLQAIEYAIENKYDALIIDSFSALWEGILDYKAELDAQGGNQMYNWRLPSESYKKVLQALLLSPIPIFCTFKKKVEYAEEKDARGSSSFRKVGLAPICREGTDYEFSLWFDIDRTHKAKAGKSRFSTFDNFDEVISEEAGVKLREVVSSINKQ